MIDGDEKVLAAARHVVATRAVDSVESAARHEAMEACLNRVSAEVQADRKNFVEGQLANIEAAAEAWKAKTGGALVNFAGGFICLGLNLDDTAMASPHHFFRAVGAWLAAGGLDGADLDFDAADLRRARAAGLDLKAALATLSEQRAIIETLTSEKTIEELSRAALKEAEHAENILR